MFSRAVVRFLGSLAFSLMASAACGQTPAPPQAQPKPDNTPSVNVGVTLFADYTLLQTPHLIDLDGNEVKANAFNIGRSYINVTGRINHAISFRITPDIVRQTGSGGTLDGSLTFRLKFAYAEFSLDDWTGPWKETRIRLGMQPQAFTEFEGAVYRYRFQGQTFTEREGFLTSADTGVSLHTNIPGEFGELFVAFVNGEGYKAEEPNNKKSLQVRATLRPFAHVKSGGRGFRVVSFLDSNHYVNDGTRLRVIETATFEHPRFNAGADYIYARDQISVRATLVKSGGQSVWVTPFFKKKGEGVEGLLRYDRLVPNSRLTARKQRIIGGLAYWFPHQGSVAAAILLDFEQVKYDRFTPAKPIERRWALHALINF